MAGPAPGDAAPATGPLVVLAGPSDSYRLGAFVRAAAELGVPAVVIGDRPHPLDPGGRTASFDRSDPAMLDALDGLDGLEPAAVVATDAVALPFAAAAGTARGLRVNGPDAIDAAADKARQRLAADTAGVRQPAFRVVRPGDDPADAALAVGFPAVVKPLRLTAGRGVLRVEDPLDARAAAALVRPLVGPDADLLVEQFVPGGEVAVEALLDDGGLQVLAVYDKPDAPQGPTFPETVLVTPSRLDATQQRALAEDTAAVCRALGLRHGPVHAEFRIDADGRPWFLELAARTIGGRCASLLSFVERSTGTTRSLEALVLAEALGRALDTDPAPGAAGVWMLPIPVSGVLTAIDGVAEVGALPGITEVVLDAAVGDHLEALPTGGRYPGFVFARGDDPAEVEAVLAKAAATLRLVIEPDRTSAHHRDLP